MYRVIPDTNFLIYAFKQGINFEYELNSAIDSGYKICIMDCVLKELEKLKLEFKGKEKLSANIALKYAKKFEIIEYSNGKYADEMIINYSKEYKDVIICTNDKKLKKDLIDIGTPIILVKQHNHFELQGYLK
ncbi:PIN domain-containing protein [Methanococcus maripaludis]|jgi:hypothetical protein|uniref:Ribonuclease VapC n=4 Tax=Methanococcus maripaludis TaxID=39152 RepID=A0A8T3VXB1_METMI|nr:PIN domain-containing protein [Methanococcus maripaludis]MDK2928526.1 uncharacterized protein [Methanococcus sp.]AEK20363.1 hypothetical protein GYY_07535 [Methanococcus maripaludis X1]MBG0768937.1 ribonuclease VapC [Methanococcus maripaludis]BAP61682.1 hypothetical protein MMKA1_15650 [Methanococcus maripaludis KA1]BAP63532.1 hypothetical protein MMOS7_14460 [Methanococcus maripaludis OS7]